MKKILAYINPMCFADTDLTVLRYLTREYKVIWYPIYKKGNSVRFTYQEIKEYAKRYGIELHIYEKSLRDRSLKNFAYFHNLLKDIREQKPDLIYTCYDHYAFTWYLFRMFDRNKIVFGFHDIEGHSNIDFRWIFQKLKELTISRCRNIVTFSKGQQQILLDKYHRDSTMVGMSSKIYGLSTLSLTPIDQGIKLLFFGSIHSYKGLDLLIAAMEELYDEGIRKLQLSIYGQGKDWKDCEALIKHKELFDTNIRFVENSELPDLFATHHFLALPYRDVTNSGPLMIAVGYAKPIIAPSIGCFSEIYDDSQGQLYKQGGLKDTLRKVATMNVDTYKAKCDKCGTLKEEYSEENIAKRYIELFSRIAN